MQLQLTTNLQAVAIRCQLHKLITICSLYLPPSTNIAIDEIQELISQLPPPFLLLGDFNARSPIWGDSTTNGKGRIIESLLLQNSCSILNTGMPTHLHIQTDTLSCIDISLCSSDLITEAEWNVCDDLFNSDHYPILITFNHGNSPPTSPRYIFSRADWDKFSSLAILDAPINRFNNIDEINKYIIETISRASKNSIPLTKGSQYTRKVPWWNSDLDEAVAIKKRATRRYHRTRLIIDKIAFKRACAKVRFLVKSARQNSWKNYVTTLNERTPLNKVWKRIKKIQGNFKGSNAPILSINNQIISEPKEVANVFANSLSTISTGSKEDHFLRIKRQRESTTIIFPPDNFEDYNTEISLAELQNALRNSKNTAAGEDQIHYHMIRHLPEQSQSFILDFFNLIWLNSTFPSSWSEAIVLPIPKPNKNHLDPTNFRPIALTSCLCKLLEKIVNTRLVWYLESNKLLHPHQYGFRKHRSTTDILTHIDTYIKTAFVNKEHVIAVFFDLHKAYDTTWKYHILSSLSAIDLIGNLPKYIQNFLSNRLMKIKVSNTLSDPFPQHEGVPQGSVLSCTLFAIAINNLPSQMPPYIETSLYVDDFAIFTSSHNLRSAERRTQLAINTANAWATSHGFIFSTQKTVCMHFHRKRGIFPPLDLYLKQNQIPAVTETRFLGLTLDSKLSWIPHLKALRMKTSKQLDILKCLSHLNWGADRTTLLRAYRALIRSQLDYGCQIYSSASNSALKMIDPIHHLGLRLALGAFRTSPVESLYAESGELSLKHRREQLSLQLYARNLAMPNTPVYLSICNNTIDVKLSRLKHPPTTFGYRMRNLITSIIYPPPNIMPALSYHIAPYTLQLQPQCPSINNMRKSRCSAAELRHAFSEHTVIHSECLEAYTDGSKSEDGTGLAVVLPNRTISRKLPNEVSIFTAELRAILTTMPFFLRSLNQNFVIYSDSRSAVESVCDPFSIHPLVVEIHRWLKMLHQSEKTVIFCWVPSHVGIPGNERADSEAQLAATSDNITRPIAIPSKDYYPVFKSRIRAKWNDSWQQMTNNKLRQIKPTTDVWHTSCRRSRREEVTLARLRIGHTRKTHEHLLNNEVAPYCEGCLVPLTVHHILSECPEFSEERIRLYGQASVPLTEILKDKELTVATLFTFLSDINFNEIL